MTVGERIIEARKDKGLSRTQLAEDSGVPYPTLAGLENGDQQSSTAIPKLAEVLGVNALWLSHKKGLKHPPAQASHSVQWDFPKLALAHQILRESYAADRKEPYSVETEPEALIEVYEKLVLAGDDTAAVVAVGRDLRKPGDNDAKSSRRTSGNHQAKGRKRAAS